MNREKHPVTSQRYQENWRNNAACIGMSPDEFDEDMITAAEKEEIKRFCGACAVQEQCLILALDSEGIDRTQGSRMIYAGLTTVERRAIQRRQYRRQRSAVRLAKNAVGE
jgi:Transcription factor WhiB